MTPSPRPCPKPSPPIRFAIHNVPELSNLRALVLEGRVRLVLLLPLVPTSAPPDSAECVKESDERVVATHCFVVDKFRCVAMFAIVLRGPGDIELSPADRAFLDYMAGEAVRLHLEGREPT